MRKVIFALLAFCLTVPAWAQRPTIFLYGSDNVWWNNKAIYKLDSRSALGVSIEQFNLFMSAKPGWEKICRLQEVTRTTYIGVFRVVDDDLQKWLAARTENPFRLSFSGGSSKTFVAGVVAYETCSSERGLAVLVTEGANIRDVSYFADEEGVSKLRWIYRYDAKHIATASCSECGDQSVLRYDISADRFYWENTGD